MFRFFKKRRELRQKLQLEQARNEHLEQLIKQAFQLVGQQQANEAVAMRAVLDALAEQRSPLGLDNVIAAWPRKCQVRSILSCQILLMQDESKLFILNNPGGNVMMTRTARPQRIMKSAA